MSPLLRRARTGWEFWFGLSALVFFAVLALGAPLLSPHDPRAFVGRPLERPGPTHPLGTNDAGQDILSELIYGTRISLTVGLGAALGTVLLGLLVGGLAGYLGGWVDVVLMRAVDVLLAMPRLPALLLLAAFLGAGPRTMVLAMALLFWPTPARVIRAQVQRLRGRGYVRLARYWGGGAGYVLARHILPEIGPLLAAALVAAAGRAVAMEAGLAFIGLGQPTAKSWGLMMRFALDLPGLLLTDRWLWWLLPPGVAVTLLILALTLLGQGLERHWQPRLGRVGGRV